jgi:hypothetical protein
MRVIPIEARPGIKPRAIVRRINNLLGYPDYVQEEALKALEERDYKSFQNCIRDTCGSQLTSLYLRFLL